MAKLILSALTGSARSGDDDAGGQDRIADCLQIERRAKAMIAAYRRQWKDFEVSVEIRDDLPA